MNTFKKDRIFPFRINSDMAKRTNILNDIKKLIDNTSKRFMIENNMQPTTKEKNNPIYKQILKGKLK